MSCHVAAFASFSRGHPEFDDYPFRRRTRIEFDHESHFGKHFRKAPESERAPGECRDCHTPDVDGRTMGVFGFEAACAGCHASQIEGAGRASAKGIPVITVPGLDIAALAENALAVGHWPAYADENATPFMDFLLAGDAPYAAARRALAGTDLMDLEDMGADERAAVETLAWSVKELISEIAAAGMPALKQRIESALGGDVAGERFTRLAALVPADTVRAFRDEGFPGLADEIARRRRGESVPIPGQAAGAATKAPAPESAASDEDDSILDDEDELLDDEDELSTTRTTPSSTTMKTLSSTQATRLGMRMRRRAKTPKSPPQPFRPRARHGPRPAAGTARTSRFAIARPATRTGSCEHGWT